MICLLDDLPREIFIMLPVEIWLMIGKYLVRFTLQEKLQFPLLIERPRYFQYYSCYWQAYCGDHRWDIESKGPLDTSLIGHSFRFKRVEFCLSGVLFAF
jgi:hypothetical protein